MANLVLVPGLVGVLQVGSILEAALVKGLRWERRDLGVHAVLRSQALSDM